MPVEVKFCGLTRAADAAYATQLGAEYTGVIFAESPRRLAPAHARAVLERMEGSSRRVGVFGDAAAEDIGAIAREAALDIVQLHRISDPTIIDRVRRTFAGGIWAVLTVRDGALPVDAHAIMRAADAVLIDTQVGGRSGGTGVVFDWARVAPLLEPIRNHVRVVVAGGLTPENVAEAVRVLAPDVVDVSSGVERSTGIKDNAKMRAFVAALGREVGV